MSNAVLKYKRYEIQGIFVKLEEWHVVIEEGTNTDTILTNTKYTSMPLVNLWT